MTRYLLDTNIILRFTDTGSAEFVIVNNAITKVLEQGDQCFITAQIITEFNLSSSCLISDKELMLLTLNHHIFWH
jgi:hypothetical protein